MDVYHVFVLVIICSCSVVSEQPFRKLPDNLLIGVATSAYQIEGAWNVDGKGESIWDYACHSTDLITDHSNGDSACNSYYKVKEDIAMLENLGVNHYRFSISWSRILPSGFVNEINEAGIKYYDGVINELLSKNITPMVTIYHWDMPQVLQTLGGWANPNIKGWLKDYAQLLFQRFGDRVKTWITINEPKQICEFGYGIGMFAPALELSGIADYLCAKNVLMAHAYVYHLYNKKFRKDQKGRIGIVIESSWSEPASKMKKDVKAAQRRIEFDFGFYANPIFHKDGDFPKIMKEYIKKRSKCEGYAESRLPTLTRDEINYIKGTSDFYGLNFYTTSYVKHANSEPFGHPTKDKDVQVEVYSDKSWLVGSIPYFRLVPWGFRKVLNYLKDTYDNPEILITENGFPDFGEINDQTRIKYHKESLNAVLDAIYEDNVNITAYTVWSLMNNFEWSSGYTIPFGLYHVDFNSTEQRRTPKASCEFFKELLKSRRLLNNDCSIKTMTPLELI